MNFSNLFKTTLLTISTGLGTLAICASANAASLTSVDIELSLLVDVSGSINDNEFNLQKQGYVGVFSNASLFNNFISKGEKGKIAVNYIYWSSSTLQQEVVGWTLIDSVEASQNFANAINGANRPFGGSTSPGSAIDFATPLFSTNKFDGERQVIDVSGDGRGSALNTANARDNALNSSIDAINGIVIGGSSSVKAFYENNVIGGVNGDGNPGFVVEASTFADFGSAIDKKIKAEIILTPPTTSIPEPASIMGLLAFGAFGVASTAKYKYKTILCLKQK
ncbi:Protein of unknown function (DUF1194) [Rivularia sp. PCC 7116]|uniref:DUF1194 domain-containing protein n=1 Tax=Rivularia sp. PCC 7116 TaxID=373994 RepID=UPI00029F030E|nr:DUF1194 domain-containing protein [Rivularia sp. PCC 7116]AFY58850.1 Protein of unknown function (DUF1194) [Rivularia sp. PCC 7116]